MAKIEKDSFEYCLRHKDVPVCGLIINATNGNLIKITDVYAEGFDHFPPCYVVKDFKRETYQRGGEEFLVVDSLTKGKMMSGLREWWKNRTIPRERDNLKNILVKVKKDTPERALSEYFGLSLSDSYWIKESGSTCSWDDVNLYKHYKLRNNTTSAEFLKDDPKKLFNKKENVAEFSLGGRLRKCYTVKDGRLGIIKSGKEPYFQQVYNEFWGSQICNKLGFDHVPYLIKQILGNDYNYCDLVTSEDVEFIPAYNVLSSAANKNNSYLNQFLRGCDNLGINREMAMKMIKEFSIVDSIMINSDRHLNNFGFLRDVNTLNYIKPINMFDFGDSYFFEEDFENNRIIKSAFEAYNYGFIRTSMSVADAINTVKTKNFFKGHNQSLEKLFEDRSEIEYDNVYGVTDMVRDRVGAIPCAKLSRLRKDLIVSTTYLREKHIKEFIKGK